MVRIVEILIAANAVCGIAAFLIARGVVRKVQRRMLGDDVPPTKRELSR